MGGGGQQNDDWNRDPNELIVWVVAAIILPIVSIQVSYMYVVC